MDKFVLRKVLCPSCDLVVSLPAYVKGQKALCPRCAQVLRSGFYLSLKDVAAVAIAALIFLGVAIFEPFLSVESFSIYQQMSLISIVKVLRTDWSLLLYVFMFFTLFLPVILLCQIIAVGLLSYKPQRIFCKIYSFCHRFCMVDVFILGVLVSLVKLTSLAQVGFYMGFYAAIVFSLLLLYVTLKVRPPRMWDLLQEADLTYAKAGLSGVEQGLSLCRHCNFVFSNQIKACPRCGCEVPSREYSCYQKAFALLVSATILYLPSNLYPIMFTDYLGTSTGSNIVDGVIALWQMDSYFVALVILFASIFIPVLKILTLSWILWTVKRQRVRKALRVSIIYRLVSFIGKWSMIDVFVVIIMSSVVRMSGLLVINPGFAIIAFCSVVLITMFAAEEFDERLIWDNRKYD